MNAINIFDPIQHVAPPRLLPLVAMAREQPAWTHYASPEPTAHAVVDTELGPVIVPGGSTGGVVKVDGGDVAVPGDPRNDPWSPDMQRYWARRFPMPALHSSLMMPAHVVTGSLRRGQNMLSVSYMRDEIRTAEVTQRRTEFQERCTRYRPDGIEPEPWREMFNKALLTRLEPRDALMVLAGLAQEAGLEWLQALPLELEGKDVWDRRAERERVTGELWERFALATGTQAEAAA